MGRILGSGDKASGLAAGVAAAMKEQPVEVEARAAQLPLMEADDLADLRAAGSGRIRALQAPRKAGRPVGSPNRSTEQWRQFLLSKYRSPVEVLCATYSRPITDLQAELACTRLEAFKIQLQAAAEAAPYLHGKMPVELVVSGKRPMFIMADPEHWLREMGASEAEAAAVLADLAPRKGSEQNQRLIDLTAERVERPQSNSGAIVQPDQSVSDQPAMISDHGQPAPGGDE
jgi:hypothetical protein